MSKSKVVKSNELVARFMGGATFPVTGKFGYRIHPVSKVKTFHAGGDWSTNKRVGYPIYMPYNGVIVYSDVRPGYGSTILTAPFAGPQRMSQVAHLLQRLVKEGEYVRQGTLIAYTGGDPKDQPNAGNTTGPHWHIGDGQFVDGKHARPFFDYDEGKKTFVWEDPVGSRYWDKPEDFEKERDAYIAKWVKPEAPKESDVVLEPGYEIVLNRTLGERNECIADEEKATGVVKRKKGEVIEVDAYRHADGFLFRRIRATGKWISTGPSGSDQDWAKLQPVGTAPRPLKVGDNVKIKAGAVYQGADAGKPVSQHAYGLKTLTIDNILGGNARLKEIRSWIKVSDLELR